jgi:toxin ParE1/3/4
VRRFRINARAKRDLEAISSYIGSKNPPAARQWIRKLRLRARNAARDPGIGRKVPEYDRDDIREVLVGSYRIVYRVTPGEVVILIVTEGHRLLPGFEADEPE